MRLSLTFLAAFVALAGVVGLAGVQQAEAEQPRMDSYTHQQVEDAVVQAVEDVTGNTVNDTNKTFQSYGVSSGQTDEIAAATAENLGVAETKIYPPDVDWALDTYIDGVYSELN